MPPLNENNRGKTWYVLLVPFWGLRRNFLSPKGEGFPPSPTETLKDEAKLGNITLLYAARDTQHNNTVALKEFLTEDGPSEAAR